MSDANLMFNLLGKDVSASKALNGIHSKGKAVAAGVAGAFGGMAIGTMFAKSLQEGKIDSQLNATMSGVPGEAKKVAEAAGLNYRAGWGTSLQDNVDAVKAVGKSLMDLATASPEQIGTITTSAMGLAKVMGTDVTNVTQAAGRMMKNGLAPDAKTALDIITAGVKSGANAANDFLPTLDKYSPTFKKLGIDGATATGMIASSIKAGAPSAEAAMQGFTLFTKNVGSGSASSSKALTNMGLDAKKMATAIATGGPAAKSAMDEIITHLLAVKDPVQRNADGLAMFGKSWGTMSLDAVSAMDPVKQHLDVVSGGAAAMGATLQDNAATKVDSLKRNFEHLGVSAMNLPGPLGMIATGIAALGPQGMAMASSLAMVAGSLKDMGAFSKIGAAATQVWTGIQWLFVAAQTAGLLPWILIGAAIAAVIAIFVLLWMKCEWFRNFWIGAWDIIKAVVGKVVDFFKAVWNIAFAVVKGYFTIYYNVVKAIFTAIYNAVKWVVDNFSKVWNAVINAVKGFFSGLWDKVKAVFLAIYNWIADKIAAAHDKIAAVIEKVKGFFSGLWDKVKAVFLAIYNWIADKIAAAHDKIAGVINKVKDAFSSVWDKVKEIFAKIVNWIGDRIGEARDKVKGVIEGIKGFFSGLWDGIKSGVKGAVDVIKNIIGGIADFFKGPINAVIGGINWMIDKINGIQISIPDWVPGIGGKTLGVNIPHIPNLAHGGIIMPTPGGTLTRIGEAGHAEAVIPLNRMGGMGTTVNITVTGTLVGTKDALAVAVHDAVKGAQRRGALPAGAFQ